jgi:cytochrome c
VDHRVVGPSFDEIAQRYRGQAGAVPQLKAKIKAGGLGNWGDVPMTPHPTLSDDQLGAMVRWILSMKGRPVEEGHRTSQTYPYTLPDGSQVKLDFPIFTNGHAVTNDVFAGWEQFNSYCFRCHGEDATGSAYAPDLRQSLHEGMTRDRFIAVAMAGNPAKGMPSWAGFFTPEEMVRIYEYVKGRSLQLIPAGRPVNRAG